MDETLATPKEQGERIINARRMTKLSRRSFAFKYNIKPSTLQAWEIGKYVTGLSHKNAHYLERCFKLENIECTSDWLIRGSGNKPRWIIQENSIQPITESNYFISAAKINRTLKVLNEGMRDAIILNQPTLITDYIDKGANLHKLKGKQLYPFHRTQYTALHFAAEHSSELIVRKFISLGIHVDAKDREGNSPSHRAAGSNNIRAMKTLLEHGAYIDAVNYEGRTPLTWAAWMGHIEMLDLLISLGANVNHVCLDGTNAMHWAAHNNKVDAIKYLYSEGISPDLTNCDGERPIDIARDQGAVEAVKYLSSITKNVS